MRTALIIGTNVIYPVVGWYGDWITFVCGLALGATSAWMHYDLEMKRNAYHSILADWRGMYLFSLSVIGIHYGYQVMLLFPVVWLLGKKIESHNLIGVVVVLPLLMMNDWITIGVFGIAYAVRQLSPRYGFGHLGHSLWHILTGIAYLSFII